MHFEKTSHLHVRFAFQGVAFSKVLSLLLKVFLVKSICYIQRVVSSRLEKSASPRKEGIFSLVLEVYTFLANSPLYGVKRNHLIGF